MEIQLTSIFDLLQRTLDWTTIRLTTNSVVPITTLYVAIFEPRPDGAYDLLNASEKVISLENPLEILENVEIAVSRECVGRGRFLVVKGFDSNNALVASWLGASTLLNSHFLEIELKEAPAIDLDQSPHSV